MKKMYGFTLIELMIVVVIIGIIAAFAYPSYIETVYKSRRSDAQSALLDLQLKMEKFRGSCARYADTLVAPTSNGANTDCDSASSTYDLEFDTTSDYYDIAITASATSSYTLTATPTAGGAQANDSKCTSLTLTVNNSNPKGAKTPNNCW